MKQVWLLNHYAQEPKSGGGTRHFDLAKNLPSYGWEATIIAAGTEHNTGRQRIEGEKQRLDSIDGVKFLWLATPTYEGNGGGRFRNMLTYSLRALYPATARALPKPDAIIGSSVHPFAAVSGALLAKRYNVPFLFEVRDLWPQTLIDMGRLSANGFPARALRFTESWLYRRADKTISLLPYAFDYIQRFGLPKEKVVWIPNGVELGRFPPPTPPKPSEVFTLMYFGAHGGANGLDNVLSAMRLLQGDPIRLRLIGDGPTKPDLIKMAADLPNVSFESPVAKNAIPALASEADAFVFNLIDAPVFKFGISSNKLFDFMAAGRPILFACNSKNDPVSDAGAGIKVEAGNPEALASAVRHLVAASPDERNRMGMAGRRYVEDTHSFESLAKKLADTLDGLK